MNNNPIVEVERCHISTNLSHLNEQQKKRLEAFLRVSWMLAEANWFYKLLVLSANQAKQKTKAENDASLWLQFLVLTTLCSKSHEGWLILTGKNKHYKNLKEVLDELLNSANPGQGLLEKQKSLEKKLRNKKSFVKKMRNKIGFHYQYEENLTFPSFLINNGQTASVFLSTNSIGDCLPMIPLGPLFDVMINLYDSQSTPQQTLKEEEKGRARKDWYNKLKKNFKRNKGYPKGIL